MTTPNGATTTTTDTTTTALTFAKLALGISSQDWRQLGLGNDPNVVASNDLNVTVERLTALLSIRIVAWMQPPGTYRNLSTSTICKNILQDEEESSSSSSSSWPTTLTSQVLDELKAYVGVILKGYEEVPYHNFEHCYHVTISVNKIMDLILEPLGSNTNNNNGNKDGDEDYQEPETFGFKDDPLMQFALMFAALVHDVQHKGIPNRQLANEDDQLALLYNDTSIAEQNSLHLAFSELVKEDYKTLRTTIFPETEDYRRFRKTVVNLVLCTDIACPDRSQLYKSKWKEAFGDPYETVERKVRRAMKKGHSLRSLSLSSHHSKPDRRVSANSLMSELTSDSPRLGVDSDIEVPQDDSSVSLSPAETSSDDESAASEKVQASSKVKRGRRKDKKSSSDVVMDTNDKIQNGDLQQADYFVELSDGSDHNVPPQATSKVSSSQYENYQVPLSESNHTATSRQSQRVRPNRRQLKRSESVSTKSQSTGDSMARHLTGMTAKFHRRLTNEGGPNSPRPRYKTTRLGLLRTVDLTGEKIENFKSSRRASVGATPTTLANYKKDRQAKKATALSAEASELRETVLMETILLASDVGHNIQGWDQMAKWSNRLFLELRKAHVQGRGADPTNGWYSNQIGFLEAYLMPLARRLDDTGVFGDERGAIFAEIVEENRERWTREGVSLTANVIREGMLIFPEEESDAETDL